MAKNIKYMLCITRLFESTSNRKIELYDVLCKKHWWQGFTSIHPTFLSLNDAHEAIVENSTAPSITITIMLNGKPQSIGTYKRINDGAYERIMTKNL